MPLEIEFHAMSPSPAVEAAVRDHVARLEQYYAPIMRCRVVLDRPHQHRRKGRIWHVRVELTVPGHELVVGREPELDHGREDVQVAIRDAFDRARRLLEDHARRERGDQKTHHLPDHGRVIRLYAHEGYGLIEAADGHEVYFHRNAVLGGAFDRLALGSEVRFVEARGDRGPSASTVSLVGKHHLHAPPGI